MPGAESLFGNLVNRDLQRSRKVFEEGAAPGRARFVYNDVRDDAMVQPDCFHILPANIKQERSVRHIFGSRAGMGDRLHHMVFGRKGVGKQLLAISGGAYTKNVQLCAGLAVTVAQCNQSVPCDQKRFAAVGSIKTVQQPAIFAQQHKLGCRTARINAQVPAHRLPGGRLQRGPGGQSMAGLESRFFFCGCKVQRAVLGVVGWPVLKPGQKVTGRKRRALVFPQVAG